MGGIVVSIRLMAKHQARIGTRNRHIERFVRCRDCCCGLLAIGLVGSLFGSGCRAEPKEAIRFPSSKQTPATRVETVSLLGRPLHAQPTAKDRNLLDANLAEARADLEANPGDPARIVWVGRRLGYLWRFREAIDVYTKGIAAHPDYAPLYRHRGHRYITLRQFDRAIADLERAAKLIEGRPDEIEPDGAPNARNIPLTSTAFNVWYHLGLARYLTNDLDGALKAYQETMKHCRGHEDNVIATTYWTYIVLTRLGRAQEAQDLLNRINLKAEIIENHAYFRCLVMFKALVEPRSLLNEPGSSGVDLATQGYGVGFRFLQTGQRASAIETFERVVSSPDWPAFGFIAAEVELTRLSQTHSTQRFPTLTPDVRPYLTREGKIQRPTTVDPPAPVPAPARPAPPKEQALARSSTERR